MISVLIPVYNFKIKNLIESLLFQFKSIDCEWEILMSDDASNKDFKSQNLKFINTLDNNVPIKLFQQEKNLGNAANRNFLIQQANFTWLLFLDADVLPKSNTFLSVYVSKMQDTLKEIIVGNIVYNCQKPLPHLLRWKYGRKKEQVFLNERKKHPILHARGANFAVKREVAKAVNFPILRENYGFVDTCFFLQFEKNQFCVVENPVYHLGIESNAVYLKKIKKAVANALDLLDKNDALAMQISLISNYNKVRIFNKILAKIYVRFHVYFEKNIISNSPSVFIFQLYKLLYMGYLDVVKNTK